MSDRRQPDPFAPVFAQDAGCGLCGDAAIDTEVVALIEGSAAARVRAGGCEMEIATDLVDAVKPGDRLLVHFGFAIARLEDP